MWKWGTCLVLMDSKSLFWNVRELGGVEKKRNKASVEKGESHNYFFQRNKTEKNYARTC